MRLKGSIFTPSKLFLVTFIPFTRAVIIFLGVICADFYLKSRIQAVVFHRCTFTFSTERQEKIKKKKTKLKSKTNPKAVFKRDWWWKNPHFVPVFVSMWMFLTKIYWIWVEIPWKPFLVYMRLKILKQQVEKWHGKMLS